MLASVGNKVGEWAVSIENALTRFEEGPRVFVLTEVLATLRVIEGVAFIAIGCTGKALEKVTGQKWVPYGTNSADALISEGAELVQKNGYRAAITVLVGSLAAWASYRKWG